MGVAGISTLEQYGTLEPVHVGVSTGQGVDEGRRSRGGPAFFKEGMVVVTSRLNRRSCSWPIRRPQPLRRCLDHSLSVAERNTRLGLVSKWEMAPTWIWGGVDANGRYTLPSISSS